MKATTEVYLLHELEDEEGTELELTATVHFYIRPAEPDVGLPRRWAEVDTVSASIFPFGEICFLHAERYEDQIQDMAQEAIHAL